MASWCENMALPPRVLIGPRPSGADGQANILSLRHPKLEEETQYLFIDGRLHEFNWFKERYGSWFLGDYVCEDGSVYYCTPVDPTFVLLPLFEAARMSNGKDLGKFRQLDEILYIEGYPGYQNLMSIAGNHMELVCEVKEVANMKFFRLDESKVLTWLCCKVHSIKEAITKLGTNYAAQGERELLKEAVQIIRENLKDEPWLTVLCKKLHAHIVCSKLVKCINADERRKWQRQVKQREACEETEDRGRIKEHKRHVPKGHKERDMIPYDLI